MGCEHAVSLTWWVRDVKNRKPNLSPEVVRVSLTWESLSATTIYLPAFCVQLTTHQRNCSPLGTLNDVPRPSLLPEHLRCLGELGFSTLLVLSPPLKHRMTPERKFLHLKTHFT